MWGPREVSLKEMMPSVFISSPIHNRAWSIPSFLQGLTSQVYSGPRHYLFLLNECYDDSEILLDAAEMPFVHVQVAPLPLSAEHAWSSARIARMVKLRNFMVEMFLKSGCDYLFSIDSDVILLNPLTLAHLVASDLDIVSPVFWARWGKEFVPSLPNVWIRGQYETSLDFQGSLREPGHYKVGGLGAVTLIHRSVFNLGVTYSPVENLPSDMWGEDRNFCIRAAVGGYSMTACTHMKVEHLEK